MLYESNTTGRRKKYLDGKGKPELGWLHYTFNGGKLFTYFILLLKTWCIALFCLVSGACAPVQIFSAILLYCSRIAVNLGSFVSSCWPTRGNIGRSTRISNPVMTSSVGGAKGCSDHRFRAPPVQLPTLHQHKSFDHRSKTRIELVYFPMIWIEKEKRKLQLMGLTRVDYDTTPSQQPV